MQLSLCSQVLSILSEVVIHIALGSFGLVQRDRQTGKLLIEIIHQGYIGLAFADGPDEEKVAVAVRTHFVETPDGTYRAALQVTELDRQRYIDKSWRLP